MITILLGVLLGSAGIWLLCLARTVGVRHVPRLAVRPGAAFQPTTPGTCWDVCHDVACGHMTTKWIPTPGGGRRCENAAQHRGAVHLTPTDGAQ
ncbi:hypothetical protein [Streptomyces sp. MK37H]|uniref:hypothetical protein n=1 Tax=Streptomyces sp. MK37H TaxID=2699117 RepID=UPI001B380F75|nr:hypothetical protein [Streptomyces sp. MK37H]MBP8536115.1 hypothetical protein [Streptomyces sp. MK37H]